MIYRKRSYGCVVQSIDSETGDCIAVEFIPDGRVERQNEEGESLDGHDLTELENTEKECSLDMVQP